MIQQLKRQFVAI